MSIETKVSRFNDLIQSSFKNAMDTVESIHQTSAEMPLEVLKELGYPEEKTESIKAAHRNILRILYGGIYSAHEELGKLVVMQAGELIRFASEMMPKKASQGDNAKQPAKSVAKKKTTAKKSPTRSGRKTSKK